jgi:hypothetical protein
MRGRVVRSHNRGAAATRIACHTSGLFGLSQELACLALSAQSNFAALPFGFDVVSLPRIMLEGGGRIADILYLIDLIRGAARCSCSRLMRSRGAMKRLRSAWGMGDSANTG